MNATVNPTTPWKRADLASLVECIATAAVAHVASGNHEAARRLVRFAAATLPVDERVTRAWVESDWDFAEARAASDAIHAIRACGA